MTTPTLALLVLLGHSAPELQCATKADLAHTVAECWHIENALKLYLEHAIPIQVCPQAEGITLGNSQFECECTKKEPNDDQPASLDPGR